MNHSNKSSDFCKIKINKSSKMPKNSKNDFQIEKSQYAHKPPKAAEAAFGE